MSSSLRRIHKGLTGCIVSVQRKIMEETGANITFTEASRIYAKASSGQKVTIRIGGKIVQVTLE